MFFPFLTKQKLNKELVILIDIGSSSVGCAMAKIKKEDHPEILVAFREDIPFQKTLSSERFVLSMSQALEHALKKIKKHTNNTTSPHVFCTLSSPWFILRNRNIRIEKSQPFRITEQFLFDNINEDIQKLKRELYEFLPEKDIQIVEKKISRVKINGYEVKNPYGKTATQMDITMTVGVSSLLVTKKIEQKIHLFFKPMLIHFNSFPLATFSTIRDIFPTEKNFFFLDITGEATDVSLVVDDTLKHTVTFPYGKNFFIREISIDLHTLHEEANTLLNMFLRGDLENSQHKTIEKILNSSKQKWILRLEKAFATLVGNEILPSKIFFTADTDIANFFLELISSLSEKRSDKQILDVRFLNQSIVGEFVSFNAGVSRDPFISTEALFAQKTLVQHR